MKTKEPEQIKGTSWVRVGIGVGVVVTLLIGRLFADTFSLRGLSYVLAGGDSAGLMWPAGSVALFWLCCVETIALAGIASNYFAGRAYGSKWMAWAAGHWRVVLWVAAAVSTAVVAAMERRPEAVLVRLWSPASVVEPSKDDFEIEEGVA